MANDVLKRNWKNAVSEVALSLLGTVGVVLAVACVVAFQSMAPDVFKSFLSYFDGGQLSLSILALSGIVFLAIRRHGKINQLISIVLYIFFFGPAFVAAVMVGLNPGFKSGTLSSTNLLVLWSGYVILHVVWLFTLLLEPIIPTAEEAGKEEDDRVKGIKGRAADRV